MKKYLSVLLFILFCTQVFSVIIRHDKKFADYTDYANQSKFNCAGYFNKTIGEGGASFVLIDPKHILTAAHCFTISDIKEDAEEVETEYGKFKVNQYYNYRTDSIEKYLFHINGKILKGKKIILHPNYITDVGTNNDFDLAIIELESSVDDVAVPILYDKFDELGKTGTFVAYGTWGVGNSLQVDTSRLKIAGKNVIDSIGGSLHLGNNCRLIADFDDPNHKIPNELGDSEPLELEFGTSGGDSGGPLFFESENDKLYLIGIMSSGGLIFDNIRNFSFYGQVNEWVRISTHKKWIESVIGH